MRPFVKLLALVILGTLTSVAQAKTHATPITFAKGSSCASYKGNIGNGKTFSLFLLKKHYLNIAYDDSEVMVKVKDNTGKLYKNEYPEDDNTYVVSPTPKKGTYYISVTPKPNYRHSEQEIEFCAGELDI